MIMHPPHPETFCSTSNLTVAMTRTIIMMLLGRKVNNYTRYVLTSNTGDKTSARQHEHGLHRRPVLHSHAGLLWIPDIPHSNLVIIATTQDQVRLLGAQASSPEKPSFIKEQISMAVCSHLT